MVDASSCHSSFKVEQSHIAMPWYSLIILQVACERKRQAKHFPRLSWANENGAHALTGTNHVLSEAKGGHWSCCQVEKHTSVPPSSVIGAW